MSYVVVVVSVADKVSIADAFSSKGKAAAVCFLQALAASYRAQRARVIGNADSGYLVTQTHTGVSHRLLLIRRRTP